MSAETMISLIICSMILLGQIVEVLRFIGLGVLVALATIGAAIFVQAIHKHLK